MKIGDYCEKNARFVHTKDLEAIVFKNKRFNWLQVNERANSIANGLKEIANIKKGDRVALLAHNSDGVMNSFFGITKVACATPINYMASKNDIVYILNDCEAETLIMSNDLLYNMPAIKEQCPKIKNIVMYDQNGTGVPSEYMDYEDLATKFSKEEPIPSEPIKDMDMSFMIYTGGTTGLPKGVMLSHYAIINNVVRVYASSFWGTPKIIKWGGLRNLIATPLFHIMGAWGTTSGVVAPAPTILMDSFVIREFLQTLIDEKINCFGLVPTMLNLLLQQEDLRKEHIENIIQIYYAASPMPPTVLKKAMETFYNACFFQAFGQTEYPTISVMLPLDHLEAMKPGNEYQLTSTGRPEVGTDVRLVDEKGEDVEIGEIGEIIAKGSGMMIGYWKKPEKTAETIKDDWLYTGDLGRMDKDGYLYIIDRKKDMIITGGENVYSIAVEECIYKHPAVLECAVIGIPDERWGEAVHAIVSLKKGYKKGVDVTEEEIIAFCKDNIARYEAPKSVVFKRSLPKSAQGKILKKDLRAKYWEGKERQVN